MKYAVAVVAFLAILLISASFVEDRALQIAERDLRAVLSGSPLPASVSARCANTTEKCNLHALAESHGGLSSAVCVDTIPPFAYAGFQCQIQFRDGTHTSSNVWVRPGKTEIILLYDPMSPAGQQATAADPPRR